MVQTNLKIVFYVIRAEFLVLDECRETRYLLFAGFNFFYLDLVIIFHIQPSTAESFKAYFVAVTQIYHFQKSSQKLITLHCMLH